MSTDWMNSSLRSQTRKFLADRNLTFREACTGLRFPQKADERTWRSHDNFRLIITALDAKRFDEALSLTDPLLKKMSDFEALYTWAEEAFNGLGDQVNGIAILFRGLEAANDKRPICSTLAGRSLDAYYGEGFFFWWSQALQCFDSVSRWHDSGPCMYLAEAADCVGCGTEGALLREVGFKLSPKVILTPETRAKIKSFITSSLDQRTSFREVVFQVVESALPQISSRLQRP